VVVLSLTGVAAFNTIAYWSLQYTQALNALLLLQSAGPLFVALSRSCCFGIRLTWAQAFASSSPWPA